MKLNRHNGFTLIEIAVVLMIIGLLIGGLIPTLSAQMDSQRISKTQRQLNEIKDALTGFAIVNGRLPCPADGAASSGDELLTGSGVAATCTLTKGVLPWTKLGVDEADAWNRRFTYRVAPDFADAVGSATWGGCAPAPNPAPTQSTFALCSNGNLNVLSAASGGTNIATNVPAVIVSHGANGLGAYPARGGAQIGTATGDELENANDNNTFVSHEQVQNGFDDLVVWLSPNTLANRMVTAGKLP